MIQPSPERAADLAGITVPARALWANRILLDRALRQQSLFELKCAPMKRKKRADDLRAWAFEEGFDRAGVAELGASGNGSALSDWLARGDHAEMRYLERRLDTRLDPKQIMPGAKSVLCVALQYHPLKHQDALAGDLWPRVARYARGDDYHLFMERSLRRLASRVEEAFPGNQAKVYVDTGPVLERELAAKAGLGSVGKNTNLLDAEIGSWFLLGEVFLTLDLEPDLPAGDLCGTCSLCLEACPTGALPEPYRLDSRRCISYWTIEHRGAIPSDIRPSLEDWVFGCDVCQEVCPINLDLEPVPHSEFAVPDHRADLDLTALLSMGREEYTEAFRRSPMKRSKLSGLQRNAAVAMGNSAVPRYTEPLIQALIGGEALLRRHAAWALGRIGSPEGLAALRQALESEVASEVRDEIQVALQVAG